MQLAHEVASPVLPAANGWLFPEAMLVDPFPYFSHGFPDKAPDKATKLPDLSELLDISVRYAVCKRTLTHSNSSS